MELQVQPIRGFLAAAKTGSITKAGKQIGCSQPALTLQIQKLEDEFNTKLLERAKGIRELRLTEEGKLLLALLEPIDRDIRQLKERFNEARNQPENLSVTVVSHNSAILYLLPGVVTAFRKKYPKAKLTIFNRPRDGILATVKNDEAQIGITYVKDPEPWAEYKPLGRFKRVLICGKDHPLKHAKKVTLEEIAKYPLILPPIGGNTRAAIDKAFSEKGLSYELALEVMGREAVKSFVGRGLGVSIMSEYYLSKENRRSFIVKDASEYFGFSESGLLVRKGRSLNKAANQFMESVQEEVERGR